MRPRCWLNAGVSSVTVMAKRLLRDPTRPHSKDQTLETINPADEKYQKITMQRSMKKSSKPNKGEIARVRAYIQSMDWRFARSMPQWPHTYVLREWGSPREFDFIARLINKFGYRDNWGKRTDAYLVIGKFKYWVIEDCLNRAAPISNAEVSKRGSRYAARHRKESGLGPISIKSTRGKNRG